MKRYFVFVSKAYYPNCGMKDFIGDFDTEPEAQAAVIGAAKACEFDWLYMQIYDSEKKEIILDEQQCNNQ